MLLHAATRSRNALKSSASFDWSKAAASGVGAGLLLAFPLFVSPAAANPAAGAVATGSASIAVSSSNKTQINQTSEDVVIDWSSFNVGAGQTTQFVQPNLQAIAVNRIGGNAPSQILGTLDANGRIVLINGNGMLFGKGSQVNVGSLIATSTGGSDANLLSGKFTRAGNQNASIVNQGRINASRGGLVALVAPNVTNAGTVNARFGTVALGGANKFSVDFTGDGLVSFAAQGAGPTSVTNTGVLAGANISLTARAAEGVATGVVNVSGTIVAQTAHDAGGTIVLDAGGGGEVSVSNAKLYASGANGGGDITLGGANESSVAIDSTSIIRASGKSGNGGKIETSGDTVSIGGRIDAGKGGSWLVDPVNLTVDAAAATTIDDALDAGTAVELKTGKTSTSGPGTTSTGPGDITIDAALTWSTTATLTLDSYHSILIDAPISVTGKGKLTLLTNKGGTGGVLSFTDGDVTFAKLTSDLMIDGARYTLVDSIAALATDIADDPSGDFALAKNYNAKATGTYASSPIDTTFSGNFEGLGNTISNLSIDDTNVGDNVGLFADVNDVADGTGNIDSLGMINVNVTGNSNGNGGTGGLAGTGGDFFQDFVTGKVVGGISTNVGGLVGAADTISDSYSTATVSGGTGGSTVGGLCGYCGAIDNSYATGNVTGAPGGAPGGFTDVGGVCGYCFTIDNSYATGRVTGGFNSDDGGLVGFGGGASGGISGSYATGTVTAGYSSFVGGLAGSVYDAANVSNSWASGNVTGASGGSGGSIVGGLVGQDGGNNGGGFISNSYATGNVAGGNSAYVGGLVGVGGGESGGVSGSYATGTVTGNGAAYVGGLVGEDILSITNSYASGAVKAINSSAADVGGLVGYNSGQIDGVISGSFATGTVTATASASAYVGGLVGLNDQDGAITNSYATTGAVTGGKDDFVGGLVGGLTNGATIADSYSAGAVTGGKGSEIGGLVGSDGTGGITDSYWDTTTSGITNLSQGAGSAANDTGITGLTTVQLQSGLPAGFDPTIWGENATINGGLPYLLALPPA
jgi:filamentous hemagglutinin family protein